MCYPLIIMGAMAAASAAAQARAQQQQAQYQGGIATMNQQIAAQNATYATQAGAIEEATSWTKTNQIEGQSKAAEGAAGVDVNSGSAVRVQSDIAKVGMQDALTIRNNAYRRAYGYQVQGSQFGAQASMFSLQGKDAAITGGINVVGALAKSGAFSSGGGTSIASSTDYSNNNWIG